VRRAYSMFISEVSTGIKGGSCIETETMGQGKPLQVKQECNKFSEP
jgi:hypothetical protein